MRGLTLAVSTSLLFLYGCGAAGTRDIRVGVSPEFTSSKPLTISVLDLVGNVEGASTPIPGAMAYAVANAGSLIADGLSTALIRLPQYKLIERQQLVRLVKEMDLSLSDLASPENLKKFGKVANVDAVVVGTVNSYGNWSNGVSYGAFVIFNARLVDTQTAKVLWSVSCSVNLQYVDVGQVLNLACDEIVTKLESQSAGRR